MEAAVPMEAQQAPPAIPAWERRAVGALVRAAFIHDRRGGPWPVPPGLAHEALALRGNTGASVAARWFPSRDGRGAVVLAHPDKRYAQHWFVREGWVAFLQGAGFDCLTFDFPAYGQSRGGSVYYPEDVLAAVEAARSRARGPLHVVGLSMGAFAALNASPWMDVEGLVLESPYPTFNAWYSRGPRRRAMDAFDALFPRTSARIQGPANLARAKARRILVAAATEDRVTPVALSRAVAAAAPPERTTTLELPGLGHLALFRESPRYREAVLAALGLSEEEADALVRPLHHRRAPGPAPALVPTA
jgi:alpha-beta hydrolase superfamily lysophospholipase